MSEILDIITVPTLKDYALWTADSVDLSSFKFSFRASKNVYFETDCAMAVQDHPVLLILASLESMTACIGTRGRVRAGPSLQLGTLSTRIALYTRRWRASPGVLTHSDYTLGAVAPLLACLRTPAVRATHGTHSRAWRPSAACQKRS